ncbi:hypothetical protein EV200_101787 [Pedobacter psychrotolerans]|uniref:Uncharacterized protein n=1 Tax=Pedobacter psychrotolerans TaxID=1843235 RepID=A0A4R2HM85_9SPHI|nr:hypothetical protein [Pedobacter psychrotolerans]TCO31337.1 hypothetical protein EV200_101787 [Pedobacter psychrotolerans]GGE40482.1 hypothetical protein GCM10011413_02870 [Pedobacter psychrotolerans]
MDDYRLNILKKSSTEINRLQLLSVFFDEEIIYKIYLRSQVIHQLFANNEELEIDKLDLFHVQFTESVIALLRKIKKSNEKNVSLIYDEIDLNEELIGRISGSVVNQQNYRLDQQKQSLKVNQSLRRLFAVLSDLSTDFPFSRNINVFSSKYANDFYFDVTPDQLSQLIDFSTKRVYTNINAIIERKLMGLLCKYDFRTAFSFGLKSGELVIEVYRFLDLDRYFLFFPSRNLFLFCDLSLLNGIEKDNNLSEKERIIQELEYKNDKLKSNAAVLKVAIPAEINALLEDSYLKISDINFLNHLNNFDVQSNILKAMLKTDLF